MRKPIFWRLSPELAADLDTARCWRTMPSELRRDQSRQIAAAEEAQQEQLPGIAPMVDGWEVAAKTHHTGPVGGTFYDWFSLDDGSLAVVAGKALPTAWVGR